MEDDEEEEITAATLRGKPRPPPLSALSAFSYIPPRRLDPKEHSYYYRQGRVSRPGEGLRGWARGREGQPSWAGAGGPGRGPEDRGGGRRTGVWGCGGNKGGASLPGDRKSVV